MRSQVTEKHRQIAKAIVRDGVPVTRALLDAGVAPTQARKGMRRVAHIKALRTAVEEELKNWAAEASRIVRVACPEVRADMIRARLALNVVRGEDKAVQSCKLLGQDREVGMFEEARMTTVQQLIMTCPADLRAELELETGQELVADSEENTEPPADPPLGENPTEGERE